MLAPRSHRLRSMRPEDYPAVLALWKRTEGVGLNESDTRGQITLFLKRNPGLSHVICHGNKIVGAVLCGHDGRRGYLHHLAVARKERGQGLGRRLIEASLQRLARRKILRCTIFLYSTNADGKAFWEHHGWRCRTELVVMQRPTTGAGPGSTSR